MSNRHPQRSRCAVCGTVTRIKPTHAYLLVEANQYAYLEPGRALLCPPCRQVWWLPLQLPLFPELELDGRDLPEHAPEWSKRPPSSVSWPRTSLKAWRDRHLSALAGSQL